MARRTNARRGKWESDARRLAQGKRASFGTRVVDAPLVREREIAEVFAFGAWYCHTCGVGSAERGGILGLDAADAHNAAHHGRRLVRAWSPSPVPMPAYDDAPHGAR